MSDRDRGTQRRIDTSIILADALKPFWRCGSCPPRWADLGNDGDGCRLCEEERRVIGTKLAKALYPPLESGRAL